jgi:hypothetical protein
MFAVPCDDPALLELSATAALFDPSKQTPWLGGFLQVQGHIGGAEVCNVILPSAWKY